MTGIAMEPFPQITDAPYLLTFGGREFFWFRLVNEANPARLGAAAPVGA